ECGLLIAGDACNGYAVQAGDGTYFSIKFAGGPDRRQQRGRNSEERKQIVIPASGTKIEKHGAGGVAGVGDVQATAGQLPQQPRVYGAESQTVRIGQLASIWHVIQNPGNFASGEVSIDKQAGALLYQLFMALCFELCTEYGGTAILPDDGVINRLAGCAVPNDGSFPLVGDADGGHITGLQLGLG